MPANYAKRFADLIAADPDVASDYAVQLYDVQFAKDVAAELTAMGFKPEVSITGLLTVHVPEDHPSAKKQKERKSAFDFKWPRKPEDRNTTWALPRLGPAM